MSDCCLTPPQQFFSSIMERVKIHMNYNSSYTYISKYIWTNVWMFKMFKNQNLLNQISIEILQDMIWMMNDLMFSFRKLELNEHVFLLSQSGICGSACRQNLWTELIIKIPRWYEQHIYETVCSHEQHDLKVTYLRN